jgi:heat shock protein HslJ/uncharacterized lipoprotein YbaY
VVRRGFTVRRARLAAVLSALVVAGCAAVPATSPTAPTAPTSPTSPTSPTAPTALTVRGTLSARPGVDLPPRARAVIELREADRADGRVVAESERALDGAQPPIPFVLRVDPARIEPGRSYAVRGAVRIDGRAAWASAPRAVGTPTADLEVGELSLSPVRPLAFASTLACGDRVAALGALGNRWVLQVDGRTIVLKDAPAASGARWVGADEPGVEVRNRGERTRVTVDGQAWPECRASAPGAGSAPGPAAFVARGNEPAWRLDLDATRLRFAPGTDGAVVEAATPVALPAGAGRRWLASAQGRPLEVTAIDRVCSDSMSGMPHPMTVSVRWDGRDWSGCGGAPASLLAGGEWVVEDIDRAGIIDRSRATLDFEPDGRLAGRASCNTYAGRWTLTGESLRIDGLAAGTRACAPSLMAQERRFLDRLATVVRFEITREGALRLLDAGGAGSVLARR